ncbi:MAG: 23S rRNA (adenine(2503)-C(2))-methyltransferase RlmN [Verrucomicrobiales bacterium]
MVAATSPHVVKAGLQELRFGETEAGLEAAGLRRFHARALWRGLHRELVGSWDEVDGLPSGVRRWLAARSLSFPAVVAEAASADGWTRKFLLRLDDGREVETVLMGFPGRHTVCVSTQAGCAMGCVFCATGQGGFFRHLRPGEIVAQVRQARQVLRAGGQEGPRNLVLMGMGEPLHNYDSVMTALDIITDTRAFNVGPARVSLSTVGVVPGILRLANERRPYKLAVSLHGADDAERSALVPVNRRWPLAELMAACQYYGERTGRRIFFEWTLVAGKNDSIETARRLAALLRGLDAHVNLIPLNPTTGYAGGTTHPDAVVAFKQTIHEAGLPCTVRQRRGIDVAAGCGQLQAEVRRSATHDPDNHE